MYKFAGIGFIVLGLAMLIWTSFSYTHKETIIDAGAIQVSADRQKTIYWPPYGGGILIVGGLALLFVKKKSV